MWTRAGAPRDHGRVTEPTSRLESSVSALVALSAVALLVWRARAFFPGAEGLIGADYRWIDVVRSNAFADFANALTRHYAARFAKRRFA